MTVERISTGVWLVERNGRRREVILPDGKDSEAEALAVVAEIENGPPEHKRRAWDAMQHRERCKAECRRRIEQVLGAKSGSAQLNLAGFAAAGLMRPEDRAVYRSAMLWVLAMRKAWVEVAESNLDPSDDANWPAIPNKVAALAAQF